MLKKVRIQIVATRREVKGSLFTDDGTLTAVRDAEPERMELTVQGRWHDDGNQVRISYEESALTGMEGSTTTLSYPKSEAGTVTMLRTGTVRTALVFEQDKRHLSIYRTPIMPFEVCVFTRRVQNALESAGTLTLDYDIELRGAQAEHSTFTLRVLPDFDKPQKKV